MRVLFLFLCFSSVVFSQNQLFNDKKDTVLYTEYVNAVFIKEGTPLNFDGTILIEPTDEKGLYYVVVLDTVTRPLGKLNLAAYLEAPNGEKEKVFIDKFSFNIKKGPEPILYIGQAVSGEKIDTLNLEIKIGFIEAFPIPNYTVTEVSIVLNKKVITIKSNKLTEQVIKEIKSMPSGSELEVFVLYKDPMERRKKTSALFVL